MLRVLSLLWGGFVVCCPGTTALRLRGNSSRGPANGTDAADAAAAVEGGLRLFESCSHACHQCFADHYQGCIAYCSVGCEDYCDTVLPAPECSRHSQWSAKVGHVFQAMDPKARMCVSTGFNGCPMMDKRLPEVDGDKSDRALPPGQPYSASHQEQQLSSEPSQPVLTCNGAESEEECEKRKRLGAARSDKDDSEGGSGLMGEQDWAMDPIAASVAAAEHAQRTGGALAHGPAGVRPPAASS